LSRIILSRYATGEEHVVVGWDRPMNTFFWQEFNAEPRNPVTGDVEWDSPEGEEWQEMLGFAGYMHNELPTTDALIHSASKNNKTVLDAILFAIDKGIAGVSMELIPELKRHMTLESPDSNVTLDLSETHNA
jgi:hypothetical protein